MNTLHSGPKLLLKQDGDTLILDVKLDGRLTDAQVRRIDRLMNPADEDCWFGDAAKSVEVEELVRQIDDPREIPWTSKAEASRAAQQRIGGR